MSKESPPHLAPAPSAPPAALSGEPTKAPKVPFQTFAQLDIRVGKILTVEDIPTARKPIFKFTIDFGSEGVKQCAGGIKAFYTKEQLVGKQVVAVMNLEPKPIAGVVSECMMLASFTETELALLRPDKEMPPGTKVA